MAHGTAPPDAAAAPATARRGWAAAALLCVLLLVGWCRWLPSTLPAADLDAQAAALTAAALISEREAAAAGLPTDGALGRWLERNGALFDSRREAWAQRVREDLRYEHGGREYRYPVGYDGYLWLRHARRILERGGPCDAVAGDACIDRFGNAPVGRESAYADTLHPRAIALSHRVQTAFTPQLPLPETATRLAMLLGALIALPAFLLARRLAGSTLGGVAGALLVALHPVWLSRTAGVDNDAWNGLLPVLVLAAALAAVQAASRAAALAWAAAAGALVGVQAAVWSGWPFVNAVVLLALGALLVGGVVRAVGGAPTAWAEAPARPARVLGVLCAFAAVAWIATAVAGSAGDWPHALVQTVRALAGAGAGGEPAPALDWPSVLPTVGELQRPRAGTVIALLGGWQYTWGALLGVMLLCLPARGWSRRDRLLFAAGAAASLALVVLADAFTGRVAARLLVLPPALLVLLALAGVLRPGPGRFAGAALLLVWLGASLELAAGAVRLTLLAVAPAGIAAAVAIAALHAALRGALRGPTSLPHRAAAALVHLVPALLLAQPVLVGWDTARRTVPQMNDAWWNTLSALRETAAPDALLVTWWDHGHWASYVARRPVTSDGASLLTHVPHWTAKALLAGDDTRAIGLLRMLACGSDTLPAPEGARGALGRLLAAGVAERRAYGMLLALADAGPDAAGASAARLGIPAEARSGVLAATHCAPPPTYLVLGSRLGGDAVQWVLLGRQDPRREQAADSTLYLAERWHACRADAAGERLECPLGIFDARRGLRLDAFVYPAGNAHAGHFRHRGPEVTAGPARAAPGLTLVAGPDAIAEHVSDDTALQHLAVLADPGNRRVLVGSLDYLRSLYVRLMLLDGRYSPRFEPLPERIATSGERVRAWRVRW